MEFFLITFIIIGTLPPIILGTFIGMLPWLFWFTQKILGHKPSVLNKGFLFFIGLSSFIVSVILHTHAIIKLDYVLTIPSSPIATEKLFYQDEVIPEAFWRSILPPTFQQPCNNNSVIVCELIESYSLDLWDAKITFDDIPLFAGILSLLVSLFVTIYGDFVFQKRKITDVLYDKLNTLVTNFDEVSDKINSFREKGDVKGLIEIIKSNHDWMLRLDAAEALAQLGNEQGINYLISSLESPDDDIRDIAKEILEGLPQ